ncbi:MAG: hydrolase [Anaerolineaceae bacterium]|nr:hydrolase [Anaerolineaceae bacterium]MCB9097980.1 hydrolase [Anaerolineales bacterium]
MLSIDNTILLVIDVQGKLAELMDNKEALFANLQRIIQGAKVLDLPIVVTEQVPEKLGPTRPEIGQYLAGIEPVAKRTFSCCGDDDFMSQLAALNRKQILMTGIETHICVYQTAIDLLEQGYEVQMVTDAVSSRTPENRQLGLERIKEAGASLTSTEMALFELLRVAEGSKFKTISNIVK